MKRIEPHKIDELNYIYNMCEKAYKNKYDLDEDQGLKAYEREIWMIGSELLDFLKKTKKNKYSDFLLKDILKVIQNAKYGRGRESFTMLLHYFKKNPSIEIYLVSLLDDEQLYAFAIGELTKLKLFGHTDKVQEILSKEKVAWKKKEAKRYIEKSKNR
ncbi:hypothetical protein [Capnocytophaga canimorsus]|uniref:hypothetical protein n=1 Tax=Capnocytophaga canimorsus TaxID=28188 RepID=UPI00385FED52